MPVRASLEERFERHIQRQPDGCWLWLREKREDGYGVMRVGHRRVRVHRFAYERFVGPIPEGFVLDHLCRVRHCANPAHLEPVTPSENSRRGAAHARRNPKPWQQPPPPMEVCKRGHRMDTANTINVPRKSGNGTVRVCRACKRESYRRLKMLRSHDARTG